ncbi:hypothetical protein [Kribbella kalugense]|uniref:Transcriptional regulator, AbiEi antitoxin, Type IV TA system n=1 Tax=Kribbella kalugense TaxID=2512221 RepID=A0A4R7ZYA6_9ACTN|nr:hypothetical protein [Kribbella kalugense]TDW23109.1 hypothetical protein EV650_1960 [Kribbella kalugense]
MERLEVGVREELVRRATRPMRQGELLGLGLQKYEIERLLRNGHLRYAHARYVNGRTDPRIAVIACAQAAHPKSVVSHFTAAEVAGLRVWTNQDSRPSPDAVWLTCEPGPRRNLKRTDVVLRRAGLIEADLQLRDGIWLTTDARTTVDIARELPVREAVTTVDHVLSRGVCRADLEAVLARQRRWPGIRNARTAVALSDPRSESALESYARVVFVESGLQTPILQVQFWNGTRWLTERVDFWWPQFRTVGEADGLEKFEAATASERRRLLRRSFERDQRLADLGLELVHFGWEDAVRRPANLIHRFETAFARASHRTDPTPTWRPAP